MTTIRLDASRSPVACTNYTDESISDPVDIAVGPDGALWFINAGNNSIGRITTAGQLSSYTDESISNPVAITAGPDDALWFTNTATDSIGRIAMTGQVTNEFYRPDDPLPGRYHPGTRWRPVVL